MRSTKLPSWTRRLLGLQPVAGPPHAFAVSQGSLRYGLFPRSGKVLEFREYHEVELPAGTFGTGVLGPTLHEERSFRTALEDLLSRLETQPTEASLVIPDAWLRVAFAEVSELPRSRKERAEVHRWLLKRLVPFRIDDLRLYAKEVSPLADQAEAHRLLLAFAADSLLSHLEASFSSYGIRIGQVSNVSLSLLEAGWEAAGRDGRQGVVSVDGLTYTVAMAMDGEPVLFRHKSVEPDTPQAIVEEMVRRELRLTRSFAERQVPAVGSAPILLFAPGDEEERWRRWVQEELGGGEVRPGSEFLISDGRPVSVDAVYVAPMMGAACTMVS